MNQQNLMPQAAQPVTRITTGQLPTELAELTEEMLSANGISSSVLASAEDRQSICPCACSYDGDDAE